MAEFVDLPRRRMLCGCAGALVLSACGGGGDDSDTPSQPIARGCLSVSAFASQASSTPGCGVPTSTTGDATRDATFRNEFSSQSSFWSLPGVSFAFLNDCDSPNAYANPRDKSILFGVGLARNLLTQFNSSLPLWQVMAHEWGHQIQFALGDSWLDAPTVAPKELEADMFAGFYILFAKNNSDLSTSIPAAFSFGDWGFNNPQHHGTPAQRGAAVLAGGRVALEYVQGVIPKSYPAIRQRFAQELAFIL
jgi:hypothetical protein